MKFRAEIIHVDGNPNKNGRIYTAETKRKFLKELLLLDTQQHFAKERIETFIDGLKREQIEKLFKNIEDGSKALKEYLESKKQQEQKSLEISNNDSERNN